MDFKRIYHLLLQAIILFFFISLSGCNIFTDDSDSLYFKANIDGNEWKSTPITEFHNGSVIIFGIKEPGPETVSMKIVEFDGEGQYKTFNNAYSIFVGGDAVIFSAHSFDSTGTVTIHRFDQKADIIEGEFEFKLSPNKNYADFESEVPFTVKGSFRSLIDRLNP